MTRVVARLVVLGLMSATAILFSPGCTAVLRVDDYESAVEALCCGEVQLNVPDCTERVKDGLARDPDAREAWISSFDESCRCNAACFARPPVCLPDLEVCSRSGECCGSTHGGGCCRPLLAGRSRCCASCRTCHALATNQQQDELIVCDLAKDLLRELADCICATYAEDCGETDLCTEQTVDGLSPACNVHVVEALAKQGACADAGARCAADR
jgi:hypothetical protein